MSRRFRQTTALAAMLAVAMPQIGLAETPSSETPIFPLKKGVQQDGVVSPVGDPDIEAAPDADEDGIATDTDVEENAAEDADEGEAAEEADSAEENAEEDPADSAAEAPDQDHGESPEDADAAEAEDAASDAVDPDTAGQLDAAIGDQDAGKAVPIPADAAVDADDDMNATEAEDAAADEAQDDGDAAARPDGAHEDVADPDQPDADDEAEAATTTEDATEDDLSEDDGDRTDAAEAEPGPADDAADEAADDAADEAADSEAAPADDATGAAAEDDAPESREDALDEAAEQAAEAATDTKAEALAEDADAAADDEGEKLTVSEEDARSSAEDFATSIADAMKPAEARSKDSDLGRDIAKGLLGGLAAYAVGQALTGGGQVALNSGDRVVVTRADGSQQVLKDDNALLFRPGAEVTTRNYDDGSTRVVVTREDGSSVITVRDAEMRVLRRTLIRPDGTSVALIDETVATEPVQVADLPPAAKPNQLVSLENEDALRQALASESTISRGYSLNQIRNIPGVRALVAPIDIEAITFDTGSAAINPDQARQLKTLGHVIAERISENPNEVFMIEGYTDTTGTDAINLALSDRRAESLALALTEYFDVPPENMVVQGFGKRFLKVPVEGDVRENRRVSVRRITDLLARN